MASGLTPIYLLPYPLSTDPVNVHGDIEDLADRLETILPTFAQETTTNTFIQPNVFEVNSATTAVRITQTGAGNALVVEDASNPDASPFVITAAGDVGIGVASPTVKLDILGGIQAIGPSITTRTAATEDGIIISGRAGGTSTWAVTITPTTLSANRTLTLPNTSGTIALTANNLGAFASTTSSQLAGVISDETGSGSLVFGTQPTLSQPIINNPRLGYATTATSAGTLTLTATSGMNQFFTGTTTHTVVLPVTSTLALGQMYVIYNNSTGSITVQSSGANNIYVIPAGFVVKFICILTSGTTAASWTYDVVGSSTVSGTGGLVFSDGPTINNLNLTGQVTGLELSFGNSIVFEGTTADDNELTLTAGNPTADRTVTLPDASGTVALTANKLSDFASTTSAELLGVISDETGTGSLVFSTSPTLTGLITINAPNSTTTALVVKGAASQSATLQEWQSSASAVLASVSSAGVVTAPSFVPSGSTIPTNGMYLSAANTLAFSTNSTRRARFESSGLLNVDGNVQIGALVGSNPAFMEVGLGRSADGIAYIDLISDSATYTDYGFRILRNSGANGSVTLEQRGTGGTIIRTIDAGAIVFATTSSGRMTIAATGEIAIGANPIAGTMMYVNTTATGNLGLVVRGIASQTANLQEWQNSAGTAVAAISPTGIISSATWQGGVITAIYGGTGQSTYTTGDILYSNATNTLAKLGIGASGQVLTVSGGVPAWAPAPVSLPSQTGNGGKYLTTDGTTASWVTINTSAAFAQDTEPVAPVEGTIWLDTDGAIASPGLDIIPLDDISNQFDDATTRFAPTYQGDLVSITNSLSLMVSINGIIQYVSFPEYVWMSGVPGRGFFLDSEGYLQFSEAVPAGSEFDGRVMSGNVASTRTRVYPFRPLDILLGG